MLEHHLSTVAATTSATPTTRPAPTLQRRDSRLRTLVLHLGPGVVAGAVYIALVPVTQRLGLPSIATLAVSGLVGVAPLQLAILRRAHRRAPMPWASERLGTRSLIGWTIISIGAAAAAFAVTRPLSVWIEELGFWWWPAGWRIDTGTGGGYSTGALIVTLVLVVVGSVVVAPLVEERYFRGFLLWRMPGSWGRATPVAHAALFAAYHVWTPWLLPTRLLAVVPMTIAVRRTRDVRVAVIAHVILNSVDAVALLVLVTRS